MQVFVSHADAFLVAGHLVQLGVQEELAAVLQSRHALCETLDADLGSLQVAHDAHVAAALCGDLAQQFDAAPLVVTVPVGEIDAGDIEAREDHLAQQGRVVGGRPECRDDFRSA